jgi:signal peptidase II
MVKNPSMSLTKKSVLVILIVLILDQTFKIWVKTHMMIGEEIPVFDHWFLIHFIENNGMAFGMELAGRTGKFLLSLFRILAIAAIGGYIWHLIRTKAPAGLVVAVSMVFAGALGNIIDSAFYGMIFDDSYFHIARLFPKEGGYASFLHGKVVDMLYFPIIKGHFPQWMPFWGGEDFIFFRPVFNISDSSITIGVAVILLFYRRFFKQEQEREA